MTLMRLATGLVYMVAFCTFVSCTHTAELQTPALPDQKESYLERPPTRDPLLSDLQSSSSEYLVRILASGYVSGAFVAHAVHSDNDVAAHLVKRALYEVSEFEETDSAESIAESLTLALMGLQSSEMTADRIKFVRAQLLQSKKSIKALHSEEPLPQNVTAEMIALVSALDYGVSSYGSWLEGEQLVDYATGVALVTASRDAAIHYRVSRVDGALEWVETLHRAFGSGHQVEIVSPSVEMMAALQIKQDEANTKVQSKLR